jgi:hypothetical protein
MLKPATYSVFFLSVCTCVVRGMYSDDILSGYRVSVASGDFLGSCGWVVDPVQTGSYPGQGLGYFFFFLFAISCENLVSESDYFTFF